VNYPGFSKIKKFKDEIKTHLKTLIDHLEKSLLENEERNNPEILILNMAKIRINTLSFEDDPQNKNELIMLFESLLDIDLSSFWNNPQIILLICVVMESISSLLGLLQLKQKIDELIQKFMNFEFEYINKWSVSIENVLTQTLPFIGYFDGDKNVFLKKIVNICLNLAAGNIKIVNWLNSLQIAFFENINIMKTITEIPINNEILYYEIFWLFRKKTIENVFDILSERLEDIENEYNIGIKRNKNIPLLFFKWICMEITFSSLRVVVANRYSLITQILPFFELAPGEFERLCFWIICSQTSKWKEVQWLGASGSEGGKDILAKCIQSDRYWIIQCKRVRSYGPKSFLNEFGKVSAEIQRYNAEGYLTYLARSASDRLRGEMKKKSRETGLRVEVIDDSKIDMVIKQNPLLLKEFFHKSNY